MRSLNRWILIVSCALTCIWCCGLLGKKRLVVPSFYYWKHGYRSYEYDNDDDDKAFDTTQLHARRVYIKFFDIDWRVGNGAFPREIFEYPKESGGVEIVPVFFVLNRVFEKSDSMDLENLAIHLAKVVKKTYPEIQLDCDWTATTRERYFQFLKMLRPLIPPSTKISVTIRLHQVKYRDKTGIPPADRGMLMLYNLGNPTDFNEKNSIFEMSEARKYLDGQKEYPLPLDIALPIFRWGVTYRSGKFLDMLTGLNSRQADTLPFLTKNDRFYTVNKDTLFQKKYLRFGDKIKIEEISDDILRGAAELAEPFVRQTDTLHIAYFHYDTALISSFKPKTYEQVFQIFNR